MTDNYLYIFNDLFFNIENNKNIKLIIEQASEVLADIITKFGEIENELTFSGTEENDFVDIVVCLFIRKIMGQLDAINVLFSVALFDQAKVVLRSLLENIVSLEFILKEDTDKRAAAYFLEHHYKEIELGEKCFKENSKYAKQIIKNKGKEKFEIDKNRYKKKVDAFKHLISSKKLFSVVNEERQNKLNTMAKNRRNRKPIQWYEVCSEISTFRGLMKETGYEKYYEGIYGSLSFETHALNSTMDIIVKEDGMFLKMLRNPEEGSSILSFVCSFSLSLLVKIYGYLNDGIEEKIEFKNFFEEFAIKRDIVCENLDKIKTS